jgi:hypothetical protein
MIVSEKEARQKACVHWLLNEHKCGLCVASQCMAWEEIFGTEFGYCGFAGIPHNIEKIEKQLKADIQTRIDVEELMKHKENFDAIDKGAKVVYK